MQILVVGSLHFTGAEAVQADFIAAARELGKALANRGHTIIIGSDSPNTADYYVVEGANSVTEHAPHRVRIYLPEKDPTPYQQHQTQLPHMQFERQRTKGPWPAGRAHQVEAADVVIAMGGGAGTAIAGYSASALKKPVVAIPSFGGSAREVWDTVHPYYADSGVSSADMGTLREAWEPSTAEVVVRIAEKLVRQNPFHASLKPQMSMLLGLIVLLVLWVVLFLKVFTIPNALAFFLLLGLAAFLGTGLRTTFRLLSDDATQVSGQRLLTEATAGLLLAFSFALLYFAGSIALTGDVKYLTLTEEADFARVAISMSLLGLAAAFLLETAAEKLQQRLQEVLSSQKSASK